MPLTINLEKLQSQPSGTTSFENPFEAELVVSLVEELLRMGLENKAIVVITPYVGQLKLIKYFFFKKEIKIEANTVDGFQGRKKSNNFKLVRANPQGEIDFLKD